MTENLHPVEETPDEAAGALQDRPERPCVTLSSRLSERSSNSANIAKTTRPLRILVVDDNEDAADSAAMLLQLSGHDVRVAYSGTTALETAFAGQPHAVLLDLALPRMDGYEVARRLRQIPGLENVLLVAVSGYGREADRQRSSEAGFDAHLLKPVHPATVEALLGELMVKDKVPSKG